MNRGITLVETLIAVAAVATIAIMSNIYLYQILAARDKALALAEATETANTVLGRIKAAVPGAVNLNIVGGTKLEVTSDSKCEEFTYAGGRIYYETAAGTCPINVTQLPITATSANVTNSSAPAVTLFTGSPADSGAITVTTNIRVLVRRPFATGNVTLQDTVSRRR